LLLVRLQSLYNQAQFSSTLTSLSCSDVVGNVTGGLGRITLYPKDTNGNDYTGSDLTIYARLTPNAYSPYVTPPPPMDVLMSYITPGVYTASCTQTVAGSYNVTIVYPNLEVLFNCPMNFTAGISHLILSSRKFQ
jgi:hypothetical protein